MLKKFGIPFEMTSRLTRSPSARMRFASTARERGVKVIIAGAGHAAHLAGVLAAHTPLPVIGRADRFLQPAGPGCALSTVQMPPGIPVADHGAGRIPARATPASSRPRSWRWPTPTVASRIDRFKKEMAAEVERKAEALKDYR